MAVAGVGTADAGPSSASKPIEEIQVGDFVWARAEHDPSAPAVLQKVVALYRNTAHDLQQLEVVGDQGQSVQIVATDEHPFYVVDVGWTTADAIQVGQQLVGAGGAVLTVVANRDWKPDGGVVVYNFQVESDHTYFVGDIHAQGEWVWTHNACSSTSGNNAASEIGRDQHALYKAGLDDRALYRKEYLIPNTKLRVDFIDFQNGIIYELKPRNARAIRRGELQLIKQRLFCKSRFSEVGHLASMVR